MDSFFPTVDNRHVQNQILIGRDWYVIYTRSWFRSCMGLRLRSRLGNFGKISRDFGKYSSRPGFSVYNLGKITEIWSRLIFFVYCSLNLNTVIVLLPRKQREKRTRSRISRSRRDLQWTEMDMSGIVESLNSSGFVSEWDWSVVGSQPKIRLEGGPTNYHFPSHWLKSESIWTKISCF